MPRSRLFFDEEMWVQCDRCQAWRLLELTSGPSNALGLEEGDIFECSMNSNRAHATCSARLSPRTLRGWCDRFDLVPRPPGMGPAEVVGAWRAEWLKGRLDHVAQIQACLEAHVAAMPAPVDGGGGGDDDDDDDDDVVYDDNDQNNNKQQEQL